MSSAPNAKFFVEKEACERRKEYAICSGLLCSQFLGQTPKKMSQ